MEDVVNIKQRINFGITVNDKDLNDKMKLAVEVFQTVLDKAQRKDLEKK